jgi:hypothetical protein
VVGQVIECGFCRLSIRAATSVGAQQKLVKHLERCKRLEAAAAQLVARDRLQLEQLELFGGGRQ